MHLLAYGGRNDNLFVGAMSESLFFPAQPYVKELEYQFDRLAQQVGCSIVDSEEQLTCLRSQNVTSLQAANHAQHFPGHGGPLLPIFYWTPCVDGDFLQDLPYRLIRRGRLLSVPILFGTNTDGMCSYSIQGHIILTSYHPSFHSHLLPIPVLDITSLITSPPSLHQKNRRVSFRLRLPHPLRPHQLLHHQLPPSYPLRHAPYPFALPATASLAES